MIIVLLNSFSFSFFPSPFPFVCFVLLFVYYLLRKNKNVTLHVLSRRENRKENSRKRPLQVNVRAVNQTNGCPPQQQTVLRDYWSWAVQTVVGTLLLVLVVILAPPTPPGRKGKWERKRHRNKQRLQRESNWFSALKCEKDKYLMVGLIYWRFKGISKATSWISRVALRSCNYRTTWSQSTTKSLFGIWRGMVWWF